MLYATASGVTTITGAFQKCNEVTSRPTGQGHEGDAPPGGAVESPLAHGRTSSDAEVSDCEEGLGESIIQEEKDDHSIWGLERPCKRLRSDRRQHVAQAIHDNELWSGALGSPRTVRGEAEFTDASSRQTAATTSKQCFLGVRSVFGSLRNSLERALSSVKNLEEDAKQHEATQDQLIEENFLANKKWLQLVTAPYENGSDVLKQIASNLGIKPAVPHHAWPSKQTLAPVGEAKLPAEVASYLKDLEGLKKPLTSALEGAVDAFHSKKGKSLVHSDSAFKFKQEILKVVLDPTASPLDMHAMPDGPPLASTPSSYSWQEVNSLELDSAIPDGVLAHSESEARLLCERAYMHYRQGSTGSVLPEEAAIIKYLDMSSTQLVSAVNQAHEVYSQYRNSPLTHVQVLQHQFRTADQLFPILEESNNEVMDLHV
ncbi:TPA: hypothetical protein ACH3X1_007753 [Trebouxia sp. C0004]